MATHYSVQRIEGSELRDIFKTGEADDLNFCLFSTSGVHGTYTSIEEAEKSLGAGEGSPPITFLVVQPRTVCLLYGNYTVWGKEDIKFLKKLRASSHKAVAAIGYPKWAQ